jgi:hypothetical protein
LLAAAEALDRLDAGETSKVELPPGSIVDPSRHQILAACRQIGVIPPAWPLPEGGWIGPIFLSAAKPGRAGGTHFTDLGKESAVVGCVVGDGLLNLVPAGKLIPPEAFVDEFFRLLYGAARAVLARGRMVCLESVQ